MKYTVNEAALPGMKALDRLVGTWKISGGVNGTSSYEWVSGGFFLMQNTVMEIENGLYETLQIIGYETEDEAEMPGANIVARSFTNTGETSIYCYECEGDILTIWRGIKGSPTFSRSTFSEDGNTLTGAWEWPGGGYQFVMTRVST